MWPKVSTFYTFYFDIIKGGLYYREIERMHREYGPVVRIAPHEVHISDPSCYDVIYSIFSKFYKDPAFYDVLGNEWSTFAIASNEKHRQRRAPLNPFFSRRKVFEMEDIVQEKVAKLCRLVQDGLARGVPVDLHNGFRAISVDVITDYAFDDCWNQLDRDDLGAWYSAMVRESSETFKLLHQFPWIMPMMNALPEWLARRLSSGVGSVFDCIKRTTDNVAKVAAQIAAGERRPRTTIFHNLLDPSLHEPGYDVPSIDNMAEEAFNMCVAAADTTGNAMTVATYHVIINPNIYERLTGELEEAFPDPDAAAGKTQLPYSALEKLPYLTAVIKEGQRLSYGVLGRLPRVVPAGGATFGGFYIPEGYTVSMSAWMQHRNEAAFPNPTKFDPDRWLRSSTAEEKEQLRLMEKCFVPFSRGPRSCIGQNLAMCELYVSLGTLFRRFHNLWAPDVGELTYIDYFTSYHPDERQKLKVTAREKSG